jgi:hypothetical protein
MAEPSASGRALPRVIAACGLALLACHFLATALYLNPLSVVGLAWHEPVHAYMEPLFRQRWSLFAPDPPMVDHRLDYQCEVDGQPGAWLSHSEELLRAHARWRVGPAASLRRLESAAIVATIGAHDPVLDQLLTAYADDEAHDRAWSEDLLAERIAATIRTSETAYRLVHAYCVEQLGRDPDRIRYRIITHDVVSYSQRNNAGEATPRATTQPWLGIGEARATAYLDAYARQKLEQPDPERDDG